MRRLILASLVVMPAMLALSGTSASAFGWYGYGYRGCYAPRYYGYAYRPLYYRPYYGGFYRPRVWGWRGWGGRAWGWRGWRGGWRRW